MTEKDLSISSPSWAEDAFGMVNFGDKILSTRLLKIATRFSDSPERTYWSS